MTRLIYSKSRGLRENDELSSSPSPTKESTKFTLMEKSLAELDSVLWGTMGSSNNSNNNDAVSVGPSVDDENKMKTQSEDDDGIVVTPKATHYYQLKPTSHHQKDSVVISSSHTDSPHPDGITLPEDDELESIMMMHQRNQEEPSSSSSPPLMIKKKKKKKKSKKQRRMERIISQAILDAAAKDQDSHFSVEPPPPQQHHHHHHHHEQQQSSQPHNNNDHQQEQIMTATDILHDLAMNDTTSSSCYEGDSQTTTPVSNLFNNVLRSDTQALWNHLMGNNTKPILLEKETNTTVATQSTTSIYTHNGNNANSHESKDNDGDDESDAFQLESDLVAESWVNFNNANMRKDNDDVAPQEEEAPKSPKWSGDASIWTDFDGGANPFSDSSSLSSSSLFLPQRANNGGDESPTSVLSIEAAPRGSNKNEQEEEESVVEGWKPFTGTRFEI